MILFNTVVEIFTRPDRDRLLFIPAISAIQPIGRIAGEDCFPICLATVNDNAIRAAVARERFPEEALCRGEIAVLAEEELNRIANTVDGSLARFSGGLFAGEMFRDFVVVGLLAGYTTVSSFCLQSLNLALGGEHRQALFNVVASSVLCVVAVGMGFWTGPIDTGAVVVNGSQRRGEVWQLYLAVGSGAAIGSLLRFLSGFVFVSGFGQSALWVTAFVNVVGSFVIMLFATLTGPDGRLLVGPSGRQFITGGICGGFTTFSAMSLDSFMLVFQGDLFRGALYLGAVVFFSLTAAWVGYVLAVRINR
jgi:CrcB protein